MTHTVGPKGQVVIPKAIRDHLGIEPGDQVSFWREDDHVAVRRVGAGRPLKGRYPGARLTDLLERDRADDRERDPSL